MPPAYCTQCGSGLTSSDEVCAQCAAAPVALGDADMLEVGTFMETSPYSRRRLVFLNQTFTIEGAGQIDPRHLPAMAEAGELVWTRPEYDPWVRQWASHAAATAVANSQLAGTPSQRAVGRQHSTFGSIILMVVGSCLAIMGVLFSLTVIGIFVGVPIAIVGGAMVGIAIRRLAT